MVKNETRHAGRPESGFTLVEIVMAMSILLLCTLALGLSLQGGAAAARGLREDQVVLAQAQTFIDRIASQEFGHDYDPDPTAGQVTEIFDADDDPGDVTIFQLSRWPAADGGWKFQRSDIQLQGEWKVVLDTDLNGDGLVAGDLETGQKVFRISVLFDDRLILRTHGSKEVKL